MHGSQYVTNSSNLKRLLAAKFFNSSTVNIRKLLGHKTLGVKDAVTSCKENKALGHFLHVFSMCSTCMTAFKISLIYVQGCEKRNPTHICQLGSKIKFGNSDFVDLDKFSFCRASFLNLDRYCFCRGICQGLINNFSSLISWSNLHGFNT